MQANISKFQGDTGRNQRKFSCVLHSDYQLSVVGTEEINEEAKEISTSVFRISTFSTSGICCVNRVMRPRHRPIHILAKNKIIYTLTL